MGLSYTVSGDIETLLDYNNFWSDANDITEVTYAVTESKAMLDARKKIAYFNLGDYIKTIKATYQRHGLIR